MPTKPALTDDDVKVIAHLYTVRGYRMREIAKRLAVSTSTVCLYMQNNGIEARCVTPRRAEEDDIETIDFYYWGCGLGSYEIARYLGVSQRTVIRRMKKHGLPTRSIQEARNKFLERARRLG